MNNTYVECSTGNVNPAKGRNKRILVIAAMAAVLLISFFIGMLLIGIVISLVMAFFLRSSEYQYEYIFIQDELNVDKIIRKEKRKRLRTISMSVAEQIIPVEREASLPHIQFAKTSDYSTGNPGSSVYILVLNAGSQRERVLLEPDAELIDAINFAIRRK